MDFKGRGLPLTQSGMDRVCDLLGVPEAHVWAVVTVETRGFGFLHDRRPQILFERHVFHRQTNGVHDRDHPGISSAQRGGYLGGAAEYRRLNEAIALDREAALKSASWGVSQIMGFNHQRAGYRTVGEMVDAFVRDEDVQFLAMARFIDETGLTAALRREDWAAFAEGYNGKSFRENQYDTRLAAAHAKSLVLLPDLALRTAQAALGYLGFDAGPVDGVRGRRTRAALSDFQQAQGLPATGGVDVETLRRLVEEAFPA